MNEAVGTIPTAFIIFVLRTDRRGLPTLFYYRKRKQLAHKEQAVKKSEYYSASLYLR